MPLPSWLPTPSSTVSRSVPWTSTPAPGTVRWKQGRGAEETPVALPAMTPVQEVMADYGSAGLTLRRHPLAFIRPSLDKLGVAPAMRLARLPTDSRLQAAGVVLLRQRPSTAKGITF